MTGSKDPELAFLQCIGYINVREAVLSLVLFRIIYSSKIRGVFRNVKGRGYSFTLGLAYRLHIRINVSLL